MEDNENNVVCFVGGNRWGKVPSHMYYNDSSLQRLLTGTRFKVIENRVRVGLNNPLNFPFLLTRVDQIIGADSEMDSMQQLCLI